MKIQAALCCKSGSRDTGSAWANARVASSEMIPEQHELGEKLEKGEITVADCKEHDSPLIHEDAMACCDQSHTKAAPVSGLGHSRSTGKRQICTAIDPKTGAPK